MIKKIKEDSVKVLKYKLFFENNELINFKAIEKIFLWQLFEKKLTAHNNKHVKKRGDK